MGSSRFGTGYRYRNPATGMLDGDRVPVDLAANAAGLGADVISVTTVGDLDEALQAARASERKIVVHVETDPLVAAPSSEAWWDVPIAAVSELAATVSARSAHEQAKTHQRPLV